MKGPWTVVAPIGSVVALVAIAAAYATYTSPKFEVTHAGTTTMMKVSVDPNDDPTAILQIMVPSETQVTTNQVPGTALGRVKAVVRALDLAGEDLRLEGQVLVAAPGQVSAAVQEACVARTPVAATWVLALGGAGLELEIPAFFVDAQRPSKNIYMCFAPPDVPVGTPGRAPFGAKLSSLEATFTGVFSVTACTWRGGFFPYTPLVGEVNWGGAVASPAGAEPGGPSFGFVHLTARKAGAGANLVGHVTQGDARRSVDTVTIFGGSVSEKLKWLGRARVVANGAFTFRARAGTFFRARAVAPCFLAYSKEVRKR
jgi:hypothetical protein